MLKPVNDELDEARGLAARLAREGVTTSAPHLAQDVGEVPRRQQVRRNDDSRPGCGSLRDDVADRSPGATEVAHTHLAAEPRWPVVSLLCRRCDAREHRANRRPPGQGRRRRTVRHWRAGRSRNSGDRPIRTKHRCGGRRPPRPRLGRCRRVRGSRARAGGAPPTAGSTGRVETSRSAGFLHVDVRIEHVDAREAKPHGIHQTGDGSLAVRRRRTVADRDERGGHARASA